MNIHEYQAKALLKECGVAVLPGQVAYTADEAEAAARALGGPTWVVKAQIHAGGRGKGGGVKLARSVEEVRQLADRMLGMTLVTHQTGPEGKEVRRVYVEDGCEIARELYLGAVIDRAEGRLTLMASTEGGVEIEEVAEKNPDALARLHVDPLEGYQPYQARRLIYGAGIDDANEQKQLLDIIGKLYRCFVESDALLCEINPLIVTPEGEVRALDSKFTVDDNALYKHPDIAEMRDLEAYPPEERAAREKGVTYVKLDGEVGILGNGAGLVMSTLDVIALAGGRPANFCDLGGGGDAQGVVDALEVITADPQVRSILFNIFGGITRGDVVARGILQALEQLTFEQPIVVRLDGTNAEEGREILAEAAPPNLHVEATMLDAARRAVELAA
jgi:succinyl-CoA synthetase beta subunit